MPDGVGKTKIKELKLELYLDDELRAALQDLLDGKTDTLEVHHLYFRHLVVEDFKHAGLRMPTLKIPLGRIAKVKMRVSP
ncbi:MAG TPA: hypothetical protein VFV52_10800 [Bacilli bacterium]|nr:hypothetical protein [Bacilli bacterium]